jgi:hypothetical protein
VRAARLDEDELSAALSLAKLEPVDGWQLYQDSVGRWILDVDLAEGSSLASLRDIRRTVLGVAADGVAQVIGSAANDVREKIARGRGLGRGKKLAKSPAAGSVTSAHATNSPGFGSVGAPHATKSRVKDGVGAPDAIIRAEKTLIRRGDHGALQSVIEFYLNLPAALIVLGRLRMPQAERLVTEVTARLVRVFDGLASLAAQVAALSAEVAALSARVAGIPPTRTLPPTISEEIRATVRQELYLAGALELLGPDLEARVRRALEGEEPPRKGSLAFWVYRKVELARGAVAKTPEEVRTALIADQKLTRSARTKAGLARAKDEGVTLGRPRADLDLVRAQELLAAGRTHDDVAGELGVSARTLRRALRASRLQTP